MGARAYDAGRRGAGSASRRFGARSPEGAPASPGRRRRRRTIAGSVSAYHGMLSAGGRITGIGNEPALRHRGRRAHGRPHPAGHRTRRTSAVAHARRAPPPRGPSHRRPEAPPEGESLGPVRRDTSTRRRCRRTVDTVGRRPSASPSPSMGESTVAGCGSAPSTRPHSDQKGAAASIRCAKDSTSSRSSSIREPTLIHEPAD